MVRLPHYKIIIDCDKDGQDVRTFVQCERPCGGLSVGMVARMTGLQISFFNEKTQKFDESPPYYRAVMFHTHGGDDRIDFVHQGYDPAYLFDLCDKYVTQIQATDPTHGGLIKGSG
jgi:hypothetical protein